MGHPPSASSRVSPHLTGRETEARDNKGRVFNLSQVVRTTSGAPGCVDTAWHPHTWAGSTSAQSSQDSQHGAITSGQRALSPCSSLWLPWQSQPPPLPPPGPSVELHLRQEKASCPWALHMGHLSCLTVLGMSTINAKLNNE